MVEKNQVPFLLTIAGSDSGGGAGIQADLRTFASLGVYGSSAITAITAQNPNEVRHVEMMSQEVVKQQVETVLDIFPIKYVKTGMLGNKDIIDYVAKVVKERNLTLVVDPVMVSTSGVELLEKSAITSMKNSLLPVASFVTPNIPEACLLCNKKLDTFKDIIEAAIFINNQYNCTVILKGGHLLKNNCATDIVCHKQDCFAVTSPVVELQGNASHGTGCTFSSALLGNLALGNDCLDAIVKAKAFVYGSLVENVSLNDTLCQMYPPKKSYQDKISFIDCASLI